MSIIDTMQIQKFFGAFIITVVDQITREELQCLPKYIFKKIIRETYSTTVSHRAHDTSSL